MNCMKRILALILVTMLMITGMAMQAFAADITINGGAAGAVYEAYKLLDATDGGNGNFAYTLNDTYAEILKDVTDKTNQSDIVKYISELDAEGVRDFADAVYAAIADMDADYTSSNGKFEGVAQGYYLIAEKTLGNTADTYSLVMLDTAGREDLVVNTKEGVPTVDKKVLERNDTTGTTAWGVSADYDMGDTVPFVITGTVSAKYADYNNYFYSFVDSMEKGLTYNGDAKIYVVNGETETEVTEQFLIAATQNAETNLANGFTAAANLKALADVTVNANSQIVVKYTCTLNAHAVTGTAGNKNQVYLEYENDPYRVESPLTRSLVKPESLSRTPNKINTVFTFETAVNKVDKSGNALAGAGFTLYKWVKDGIVVGEQNADGWVAIGNEITGVTTFRFIGLDAGKYKLVESTVPAGYNKCDDIEFSISAEYDLTVEPNTLTSLKVLDNLGLSISEGENAAFAADPATGVVTTSVVNLTGAELPGTGGIGTYIFYGVGACLVLAAVVLLITKKRMQGEEDK